MKALVLKACLPEISKWCVMFFMECITAVQKPGMRSVKQGDWKLIKYDVMQGSVQETQLFNLRDNPAELLMEHHDGKVTTLTNNTPDKEQVNLANDPRYAAKLAEMESLLLSEMRRLHDPWRLWNQPADGLTPPLEGKSTKAKIPKNKQP